MANYKLSLQNSSQFTEQFSERLHALIAEQENASAVARAVGVAEGTIRKWKNGISSPNIRDTALLAKALKVNLLWLATGEGPKTPLEAVDRNHACEQSTGYGAVLRLEWVRKAVEAVEIIGKDAPSDRKAAAVERAYVRLAETQGEADMLDVMRIIQTALKG